MAEEPFPPSHKDAIVSAPGSAGEHVLVTVNKYPRESGKCGTLIEETSAYRLDVELFWDVHFLLWDAELGETLDVREDAYDSGVDYESSKVPEVHLRNRFRFGNGDEADLRQDVLVSVEDPAFIVRNDVAFEDENRHTIFTFLNPGITEERRLGEIAEAYVERADGYGVLAGHDGNRYFALAQERPETGTTRFDGRRIGKRGVTTGPTKSAWSDIYEENDGRITDTDYETGPVDLGGGLEVGRDAEATWLTAVGFGTTENEAIESVTAVLDRGYEAERRAFASAWRDWHETVRSGPTGDATADRLYELSLTSIKCAQDPRGAMIAGAFKPSTAEYRYVWPRDLTVMIQALAAAGATREARAALAWLDRAQIKGDRTDRRGIDRKGTWWQNYYVDGNPNLRKLQLDQVGGPIYAHWLLWEETSDGSLLEEHYRMSELAADFLLGWDNGDGFPRKHQDPWEETWGYTTEGSAAAIAGLRSMGELADANGESDYASRCRDRAETWAGNFDRYCFKTGAYLGDHYVTADDPEEAETPPADRRPDAASFMAAWPWNVKRADSPEMVSTVRHAEDDAWKADHTPCVGRYPGDVYTPTDDAEDGGWPLCEAYADVVRWWGGVDGEAVTANVFDESVAWTTAAGLFPERVDGEGRVRWNSNLQWSQAAYVLLVESHERGRPYGLAPAPDGN